MRWMRIRTLDTTKAWWPLKRPSFIASIALLKMKFLSTMEGGSLVLILTKNQLNWSLVLQGRWIFQLLKCSSWRGKDFMWVLIKFNTIYLIKYQLVGPKLMVACLLLPKEWECSLVMPKTHLLNSILRVPITLKSYKVYQVHTSNKVSVLKHKPPSQITWCISAVSQLKLSTLWEELRTLVIRVRRWQTPTVPK